MCEEGGKKKGEVFAAPITLLWSYLSYWQRELTLLCPFSSRSLVWYSELEWITSSSVVWRRMSCLSLVCVSSCRLRSAAHFSVDVMPLRLCDGGCCLAVFLSETAVLSRSVQQTVLIWLSELFFTLFVWVIVAVCWFYSIGYLLPVLMQERDREEQGVCWDSSYTIHHTRVRFLLFDVLDLSPGGTQAWWLSCFIKVWESVSAHVAPQAQLYFYHRCRVKTLFCCLFLFIFYVERGQLWIPGWAL